MSFTFPGSHTPRTPDAAPYNRDNQPLLPTPDAVLYQAARPGPLHPRAPLLVAPGSNDPNHLAPFRRPSFSSITQSVIHSPSTYKSRTGSSTTRAHYQTINAATAPVIPHRVGGSGTAPSRSCTISSGPSIGMSQSGSYPNLAPSFLLATGRQNDDPTLASSSHHAKSRHTNGNKLQHQHTQQPPVYASSPSSQLHPMLRDIALINAVTVARRGSTEFRWYPVWVIAIKDWMFPNSNTATVACNLAPQYALEYTPKPGVPSHGSTPGSVARPKKTWVIPDFAQVLQYVQTSSNGSRIRHVEKVILLVENKPKMTQQDVIDGLSPFQADVKQIHKQAVYAFLADPSLHVIGVILAYGTRWRYTEIHRPLNTVLHACIEGGDLTYRQSKGRIPEHIPAELEQLSSMADHQSFELLDDTARSARAFEIIASRIKGREGKTWNL
ncbi:hypothetical protein BDR07DRAFT_1462448 [Suillus spraguei]|nr:hypothetical protein BDR07DRAFT_1462448 [Suillus spraguei]